MIKLKPYPKETFQCVCGDLQIFEEYLWQGVHVCEKYVCSKCSTEIIKSIPINQSVLQTLTFFPGRNLILDSDGNSVKDNWFSEKLKCIGSPVDENIDVKIEIFRKQDNVLILNTLDFVYGHSFLFLMNLQRLFEKKDKNTGIIVLVQPMLRWLVPEEKVSEIWTANLGFEKLKYYYPDLSNKINEQFVRFNTISISRGHILPTNENIRIEEFTHIMPFDFLNKPLKPRITFVWREDADRLWIKNIYLLKGLKKLGFTKILRPVQWFRVSRLFTLLRKNLGEKYCYTVTGLGTSGKLPLFIEDQRIKSFDVSSEKKLCTFYSESILVIGVHGSSMLLPSAHAGMTISLMPSKRWGNFLEDILFQENDIRLASFQKRVIPVNMSLYDIRDIVVDMITGRDYFIKKFIHSEEI